ncbi:hypothetical protein E2562_017412 [Oryza meyeriana var. granulata]|uniref:Uncharacterized protein n=1 Tax=Oryza meyeriana var. granulata TaxID=110450 RepID=A0A6G1D535_9ORYZ|nr:hypothetical protein E2562_017412 [Oryza meyeriana var. granulata]
MKQTGELAFSKNNYFRGDDPALAPKRGRERPPKAKDASAPAPVATPAAATWDLASLPCPCGRLLKPKDPIVEQFTTMNREFTAIVAAGTVNLDVPGDAAADLLQLARIGVTTCGLTPAQARKASKYVSQIKSPSNPDTLRAFLASIGLLKATAATIVAKHPQILRSKVDKTLTPLIAQLRKIGLSPPQMSRMVMSAFDADVSMTSA